ncbi:MAG: hypothetical protein V1744_03690 [Candidatus Altiarchaeota archaeon]
MSEFRSNNVFNKRSWLGRTANNSRRQMLDMRRQKYFRFDLDDMLVEFEVGDNKNTISATLLNKMTSHSMDDAFGYVDRLAGAGTLSEDKVSRLKALLQRYSKWR